MVSLTGDQLLFLHSAIVQDIPASVKVNEAGEYVAAAPDFFEKLQDLFSPTYRRERLDNVIKSLRETLHQTKYSSMAEAEASIAVESAKELFKQLKRKNDSPEELLSLEKQLLASRLAISLEAIEANSGFYEFASKHYLYHYMGAYGDLLREDSETHEIEIKCEGVFKKWSDLKTLVESIKQNERDKPKQPWVYGPKGLQNRDLYDWSKLEPFKQGDPKNWGEQWIFELCACSEKNPRKNLDHSWIRLYTPTGEIYSVGLYRPQKEGNLGNLETPLRIKRGYLQQPDLSEFYPCKVNGIKVKIDQKSFENIVKKIESDKKGDKETFHALDKNCTQYNNCVAKVAGLSINTKRRIWRLIVGKEAEKNIDLLAAKLPQTLVELCERITALFTNLLLVLLGATEVDKQVVDEVGEKTHSYIKSFCELFDPEKASIHHPHTLGHELYNEVEGWRKRKKEKIEDELKKLPQEENGEVERLSKRLQEIDYDLPKKYKKAPEEAG